MNLDTTVFRAIHGLSHHSAVLDAAVTQYALWIGLAALSALFIESWWRLARHGDRAAASVADMVLTGFGSIVALLVNQKVLSPLIARPRPCQVLENVRPLLPCNSDFSMPSDHTVVAGALAAGLLIVYRRGGGGAIRATLAVVLALALAVSRVYVGVHYPSDAVAGLLFGAAATIAVILVLRHPMQSATRALVRTRLRRLILAPTPTSRSAVPPLR